MICKSICVKHFRNIESAEVNFTDKTNILVGMNAQGKTNLLEGICYFGLGKSFKSSNDKESIMFGHEEAELGLVYEDSLREQQLKIRIFKNKRKYIEQNGVKVSKISDMIGAFRVVLFCPEHLSLVKDGPSERRNFLDIAISQLKPMYLSSLQKYAHILKERNRLIKDVEDKPDGRAVFDQTIDLWSVQLAHEAAYIAAQRLQYINAVKKHVVHCFQDMTADRELPDMHYSGSAHLKEEDYSNTAQVEKAYVQLLTSNHEREISAGATLWGIHKDDILITLNGKEARQYASQGQQRSLALAMKLAEGELCYEDCGEYPVFLFDDVLSELDYKRKDYLINEIKNKQVIMTTCEPSHAKEAHIIRVEEGHFLED